MRNIISYNSWNEFFKAPFGALKVNEGVDIRVRANHEIGTKKITAKINETKINKTDKPLARLVKEKKRENSNR